MAIRIGGSTPNKFYVGSLAVNRLYQGSNLVWEPEPPAGGPLLPTATWWVDAGTVNVDRLTDLSGGGVDAVFGVGAEPVVLAHTDDDYLYIPDVTGNQVDLIDVSEPTTESRMRLNFVWDGVTESYLILTDSGHGLGSLRMQANGRMRIYDVGGGGVYFVETSWYVIGGQRHTVDVIWRSDGTVDATLDDTTTHYRTGQTFTAGGDVAAASLRGGFSVYRAQVWSDQTLVLDMDPANISGDYATIPNTGSAGGDWTISRATTGYTTAVVDRSLLAFGGAQDYTTGSAITGAGTRMRYRRSYGAGGAIGEVVAVHDGTAPSLSGVTEQWVAEAIWDRVLDAAEITQAAAELLAGPPASLLVAATSCSEYDGVDIYPTEIGGVSKANWVGYGPPSGDGTSNPTGDSASIMMPVGATRVRFEYAKSGGVVTNSRVEIYMGDHNDSGPKIGEWFIPASTGSWSNFMWADPVDLTTPVPSGYNRFWLLFEADNYTDMMNLRSLEFLPDPVSTSGKQFTAEGSTAGNAVTTADSYPDAFDIVEGSVTYTASGYSGNGIILGGESATTRVGWDNGAGGAMTANSVGFWANLPQMSDPYSRLFQAKDSTDATSGGIRVYLSGEVRMMSGPYAITGGAYTAGILTNEWYWFTLAMDQAADEISMAIYDSTGSLLHNSGVVTTAFNGTEDTYAVSFGRVANGTSFGAARFDNIHWKNNEAVLIPPVM